MNREGLWWTVKLLPRLGALSGLAAGDNLLLDLAIPSEKSHQPVNKNHDSLKTAQGPGAGRPSGTAAVGTHPRKTDKHRRT